MNFCLNVLTNFWREAGSRMMLTGVFSLFSWHIQAQELATWMGTGVEYQVRPVLGLHAGMEWRTKDNGHTTDRWGMDFGMKYALTSFLKLGAGCLFCLYFSL